jgi:4-amino-4-deoxy-L-arabinose transferase-like glycosyltransferase
MTRRREALTFASFLVAALAARIAWFGAYRRLGMDCDGAGYLELARAVARGQGFVTDAHRFLFLDPGRFPHPDAHWSPLYPLLTAGSFALFGESFTAAKLVPLAIGALVPALTWLFARAVTRDERAAVVAGALAVVHPALVTWSLRIETEILTVALVFTVLTLALTVERTRGALVLGAALGLAWLAKSQSVALVPPVATALFLRVPPRRAVALFAAALAAGAVVIAPWLVRNALAFGRPFASDLGANLLSYYAEFGGEPRFLSSLAPPPDALSYLGAHPASAIAHLKGSLRWLASEAAAARFLSPLALVLAAIGLAATARARVRAWAPLALYAAILVAAFALTIPQARYLLSLVPIALVAAGAGASWLFARRESPGAGVRGSAGPALAVVTVLGALVVGGFETSALVRAEGEDWTPWAAFCGLETEAAARWLGANRPPREPVLAAEVYHAAYVTRRPSIQIPFDDSTLAVVSARFGARTMFVSERELARRLPGWLEAPPPWAHEVARLSPEQITAGSDAPAYDRVTPVRIYRLDPPPRAR